VINIPYSINVPFYIETMLVINPFLGNNDSPILLNPPLDQGCVGFPFLHNPGAYDPDGDSLSYKLVDCRGEKGQYISGFSTPTATNSFSIDPISGTLTWDSPVLQGEYNIAILIEEWRNGVKIGYVTRDMQVLISACNNNPPEIDPIQDTCVEVGQTLILDVDAIDTDNDFIYMTATGGPLILQNSSANYAPMNGTGTASGTFSWTPICEHIQKNPYQIVFKAKDDGNPVELIDLETVNITVVAPAPKNLTAVPKANKINLSWNKSYCTNAKGYDIYRRNSYLGYNPNYCVTGVPAWTGYKKIGSTNSVNDTVFVDDDKSLLIGPQYCYMVVAVFPDGAESYPSNEACASLIKDVPVITHNTIDTTDFAAGKLTAIWSKPTEIDSAQTPGPFKYIISHSNNGNSFTLIDSTSNLNDTIYQISNLNTKDNQHFVKIDFINDQPNNRFKIGQTYAASSIFLKAKGLDNMIELSWDIDVPWKNDTMVIYRQNQNGQFDSIAFTTDSIYIDTNLANGVEYCYQVKSIGSYSGGGFIDPIVNYSQNICVSPEDNTAPCAPTLYGSGDCYLIENFIYWTNTNNSCANDVIGYKLYYKNSLDVDYVELYTSGDYEDTSFIHNLTNSIAGCYTVVAVDSFNNYSESSNEVCIDIDSCDTYKLPNVFTPNGDGFNDVFKPFPYSFVEKVDMKIYNRWGSLVYETEDPDINWDGKNLLSGEDSSDGVYFYVCQVFEWRLEGLVARELRGSVTIIRDNN
jgi:gliding motility-associated-like protein